MEVKTATKVGIEFDKEAQKELAVPLGQREFFPYPAMKIGEALVEQGVTIAFGAPGGHMWPMVDAISRIGINTVTVGNEVTAVYAAEAYSQVSKKLGVCYGTAGPGMTNMVTGVNQAFLSQTPLLVLAGAHDPDTDGQYNQLQEGYGTLVMGSMTKSALRAVHPNAFKGMLTRSAHLAQTSPRGPVALEVPVSALLTLKEVQDVMNFGSKRNDGQYMPNWRGAETASPVSAGPGEPKDIAKAVAAIQTAKAPIFLIGDGAMWSEAGPELEELVNLLKVPFTGRRLGRGVVSDRHPHAIRGKVPFSKETDLLIGWGTRAGGFDNYGKGWPQMIQIAESAAQLQTHVRTPVAIVGNLKSVAQAMIDYIKANQIQPPAGRDEWVAKMRQQSDDAVKRRRERATHFSSIERYKNNDFLHFAYVSMALGDYLAERYESKVGVVLDGFSISDYAPAFLQATRATQILSSSDQGGVGHGIGMAIGMAYGQAEKGDHTPIIALMGDSGMGAVGPDIEVAARHNLPIVFLVTNNNGWMPASKYFYYGKDWEALGPAHGGRGEWNGLPVRGQERLDQDWAGVGKSLGLYAETVRRQEDFEAALHRCFQAAEKGQTAVLDCIMDPKLTHREVSGANFAIMYAHLPYHEQPKRGKAIRRATLSWAMPGLKNEPEMPVPDPWDPEGDDD